MKNLTINFLSLLLVASFFSSCSEDENPTTVSGTAVKGIVQKAKVDVYKLSDQGARLEVLASTRTDVNGEFSTQFDYKGLVEVVISEGSYKDEATGETVNLSSGNELRSMISTGSDFNKIGVSALTTIAAFRAAEQAEQGLAIAIENANKEVADAFGLSGIDISKTVPADISVSSSAEMSAEQKTYGAVLAGLSQTAKSNQHAPEEVLTLVKDLAEDFKDGQMDGKSRETALSFTLEITPAQALEGLQTAIDAFLQGPENKSGMTSVEVKVRIGVPGGN